MYPLTLSSESRSQLADNIRKNGSFSVTLVSAAMHGGIRHMAAQAKVTVEKSGPEVAFKVTLGDTVNTFTLARGRATPSHVAVMLEDLANGVSVFDSQVDPADVGPVELMILDNDAAYLLRSIAAYRKANDDIDRAVELGHWGLIYVAQNNRTLHANTIALIVNKYAGLMSEGVRP